MAFASLSSYCGGFVFLFGPRPHLHNHYVGEYEDKTVKLKLFKFKIKFFKPCRVFGWF